MMRMYLLMHKFFCTLHIYLLYHFPLMCFAGCFQYELDLSYRNYREVFSEQEEAGKEQAECTHIETYLRPCWAIVRPATWYIVAVQRGNDDNETLEPHTYVHDD